jgi:hypothetical protein
MLLPLLLRHLLLLLLLIISLRSLILSLSLRPKGWLWFENKKDLKGCYVILRNVIDAIRVCPLKCSGIMVKVSVLNLVMLAV